MSERGPFCLVGDIGGTNARFALAYGTAEHPSVQGFSALAADDFETPESAIHYYLECQCLDRLPDAVVLSVAGPVANGAVTFTNRAWSLSEEGVRTGTGIPVTKLLNDFAALALSIPSLSGPDLHTIGPELDTAGQVSCVVLGPGTGFGASILLRSQEELVIPTESGHITLPTESPEELALRTILSKDLNHVSVENIVSGPGLVRLYRACAELQGAQAVYADAGPIASAARAGDPLSRMAVDHFIRFLATAAGDIVLATGSRGGAYVAGGILPRLLGQLDAQEFRRCFENKGVMQAYMSAIPVRVITHRYPALLGAARFGLRLPVNLS
ncbi:glucokinase [Consotaella aegiceratis]|uniref:glucokinase n=1 Tax=Consotaella aegiceratis TaxID=3097961 RepID=UPI002F40BDC6